MIVKKGLIIGFTLFSLLVVSIGSIAYAAEAPSAIDINIPAYTVTTIGNLDYVEIPGGETLMAEEGRPQVPYYTKSVNYPQGYRVQGLTLKERSGLQTATGLRLAPVTLSVPPESTLATKGGWYPEEDFNWKVWDNPDGSTTLVITLYPFYYNPDTTEVKFYQNYHFDIEHIFSDITITALHTDKDVYEPGEEIAVDAWLKNSGQEQDVVVSMVIKQYGSDETIASLPLRTLKELAGDASISAVWDSAGVEPGGYLAEVTLTDSLGNLLDNKRVAISLVEELAEGEPLSWDINEDGQVDYRDLAILGANYGSNTESPYPRYDINQDGQVDLYDRELLVAHYKEVKT
jgi:hypothetical protein